MSKNYGKKIQTEEKFRELAQNKHRLSVIYNTIKSDESFSLIYNLEPSPNKNYKYVLYIEEGSRSYDPHLDLCSVRDSRIYFVDIDSVITYLKTKEQFKVTDWIYS